jgi:hypothetical protein
MGNGLPTASSAPAAPTPAATPEPTGLQFGTAGVGTGPVEQQTSAPQAAPQAQNPYAGPMQQQQMYRPQMQQQAPQYQGLQQLLSQMLSRYQQPQQRVAQSPQYQSNALGYRPNMALAQQNLGRTATSQQEAQAAAAKAAQDALNGTSDDEEANFQAWQRQQYRNSLNRYDGGGG